MTRIAILLICLTVAMGCYQTTDQSSGKSEQKKLAARLKSLIKENHPDFDSRRPSSSNLFDFMIGKRRADFPILFSTKQTSCSIDSADRKYSGYEMAAWMSETQGRYEDRLRFDVFWTKARVTGKPVYLVLAQSNDVIVAWQLFENSDN